MPDWTLLTVDFGETVMREPLIHMLIPTANSSPLAIETIKMRAYEHRVWEVEHSTFTPLVMSFTGGLGNAATVCYKRLASMLSSKRDRPYSSTIAWIRCALSFSLLRSFIQSIRGARSSLGHAMKHPIPPIDLITSEVGLTSHP